MVHYAEGHILIYNSQLEKITGYSKKEIPDVQTWLKKLYPDETYRKKVIEDRKKSILKGRLRVREVAITRKCGQKPICQFSTILLASGMQIVFVNDVTDQKRAEAALKRSKIELEHRIRERTKELEVQTHHLAEMNTTLRVLLTERSKDKEQLEERVLHNVKELVLPYIEKLNQTHLDPKQKSLVNILTSSLHDITSTFSRSLPIKYLNLTPSEIQIANLLKQGKTTKEISELLNLSGRTIETHRKNIRKKLGLKNSKTNLRSHLLAVR
jgi:PAS domain S-box-containing protein